MSSKKESIANIKFCETLCDRVDEAIETLLLFSKKFSGKKHSNRSACSNFTANSTVEFPQKLRDDDLQLSPEFLDCFQENFMTSF